MKVTEKDVAYVAELANLELTDEERSGMLRDLNSILEYIDRLNELDTSDVRRWRRFPTVMESTNRNREASDSLTRAARTFAKDCASRCRMKKLSPMRPTRTKISSEFRK